MRPNDLLDVSNRFAKHPDTAGKRALTQRFMGQHRNAQLLQMIAQNGLPSVMPVGLMLQPRNAQTWPEAQAEWLKSHPVK